MNIAKGRKLPSCITLNSKAQLQEPWSSTLDGSKPDQIYFYLYHIKGARSRQVTEKHLKRVALCGCAGFAPCSSGEGTSCISYNEELPWFGFTLMGFQWYWQKAAVPVTLLPYLFSFHFSLLFWVSVGLCASRSEYPKRKIESAFAVFRWRHTQQMWVNLKML